MKFLQLLIIEKEIRQNDDSIIKSYFRKYFVLLPITDEQGVRHIKETIFGLAKLHKWGDVSVRSVVYPKDGKTSNELLNKIT